MAAGQDFDERPPRINPDPGLTGKGFLPLERSVLVAGNGVEERRTQHEGFDRYLGWTSIEVCLEVSERVGRTALAPKTKRLWISGRWEVQVGVG